MPLPYTLQPGQTAQVAEQIDANFAYLYNLISGTLGNQVVGTAIGSSIVSFTARVNFSGIASALAGSTATARALPLINGQAVGTATGGETVSGVSAPTFSAVGTATGVGNVSGVSSGATSSLATATGTATVSGAGLSTTLLVATATGGETVSGVSNATAASAGSATGVGTATAVAGSPPVETASGTYGTRPSDQILASNTPGAPSSSMNTFALTANPGQVLVNGVADATAGSTNTELYYLQHVLYRQTSAGTWLSWASAGVWNSVADPTPQTILESVEGFSITSATKTIYASSTPGQAALTGATVGNGLSTYTLTANPGVVVINGVIQNGTGGGGNGAILITPGSGSFTDSSGNVYTLDTNMTATENGVAMNGGGGTSAMELYNGTVYAQDNNTKTWYTWDGSNFNPAATAPPTPTVGSVTNTSNVVQLYYHNHTVYLLDTSSTWHQFTGAFNWPTSATPVPTTPTINVATVPNVQINTTFQVSGSYQAYAGGGTPTLQYQDNGSGLWNNLSSTVGVTATTYSFVHPPVTSNNPSQTVSVRDANSTGTIGRSNAFQVFTPGQVTLGTFTLSNTSGVAGQPAGQVIGQCVVTASGGTFTGAINVSGTDAAKFSVNATYQLVTSSVLAAGSYAITLTAVMANAVNSPLTLSPTITIAAESANATSVGSVGPQIVGSNSPGVAGSQYTWALVTAATGKTNFQVSLNGVVQTVSNAVSSLYYINHTLYENFSSGGVSNWAYFNGTGVTGNQTSAGSWTSCPSPVPVINISTTTIGAGLPSGTQVATFTLSSAQNAALPGVTWALSGPNAASFTLPGNALKTNGVVAAGTYNITVTATI